MVYSMNRSRRACQHLRDLKVGVRILIPITSLFILLWIFVIASAAVSRKVSGYADPAINWSKIRPDNCMLGQVIQLFFGVGVETIHLPIHLTLYVKNLMHPVAALVLSIFLSAMWAYLAGTAVLSDMCTETLHTDAWYGLLYTRNAIEGLLTIFYLVYLGVSAAAVHRWRNPGEKISGSFSV